MEHVQMLSAQKPKPDLQDIPAQSPWVEHVLPSRTTPVAAAVESSVLQGQGKQHGRQSHTPTSLQEDSSPTVKTKTCWDYQSYSSSNNDINENGKEKQGLTGRNEQQDDQETELE
ncbi:hypothetical protein QQP08_009718 [Theobroma cacao]|nr:hypothetical protein QQP08_009718 [Theobroma cacao]